jgi:hypothetical protein
LKTKIVGVVLNINDSNIWSQQCTVKVFAHEMVEAASTGVSAQFGSDCGECGGNRRSDALHAGK